MKTHPTESVHSGPFSGPTADTAQPAEAIFGPLSLTPDRIQAPAFFVDTQLSIRWMATGGTDPFSTALARELRSTTTRNVFNLLLRPAIKHAIADWRSFFSFVYGNLQHASTTPAALPAIFPIANRKTAAQTAGEIPAGRTQPPFSIDSCSIGTVEPAQRVYAVTVDKGTLFVLRLDRWAKKPFVPVENAPGAPTRRAAAQKQSIGVLSARLNHAHGLAKSMLPEWFITLINRIGQEADDIVRSLAGRRIPIHGPQFCFVFFEHAGRNPIFSAICCAVRLNNQMALLEEKLGAQYGWSTEIRLNMGIGHGFDDPKAGSDISSSPALVIPGGAFDQATRLSAVAGKAEIWITQPAAAQLPTDLIDQVVLGTWHQGRFMRNRFDRLSSFKQMATVIEADPDREDLSVAQVRQLERHLPDHSTISED